MLRRLSTCCLALSLVVAYATAGQGRAIGAGGSWIWEAAADSPVLSPAERTSVRPGRLADGSTPVRAPVATLPAPPCWAPPAGGRPFGAASSSACHPSPLLETSRTSRGPPAQSIA